jgi:hypothetical protein
MPTAAQIEGLSKEAQKGFRVLRIGCGCALAAVALLFLSLAVLAIVQAFR